MRKARTFAMAAALGGLSAHATSYLPFLADDALISLRYSRRLIEGHGLTWTDGERVEGYTNLLWVLLNALPGWLGLDLVASARALCFLGAVAAIYLVCVDASRPLRPVVARTLAAGFLLAATAPLAVWAIGGLEQGFMAGVLAAALLLVNRALEREAAWSRDALLASFCFAALALLRADGVALFAFAMAGVVIARGLGGESVRRVLAFAPVVSLFVAAQLLFRLAYYGEVVPNTARAKVAFTLDQLRIGLGYVAGGLTSEIVLCALAAVAFGLARRSVPRHRLLVPACVALGWMAYLAGVGGDTAFAAYRQLLLALVPLALIVAEGAAVAEPRLRTRPVATALGCVAIGALHLAWQAQDPIVARARIERWEWGGKVVGEALATAFAAEQPLVAVDAAGSLPYWSGLPALDMLGLNDAYLARHRPDDFGKGATAHELGDGRYVWEREPDVLAFVSGRGEARPRYRSGREIFERPDFRDHYQQVRVGGRLDVPGVREDWVGTLYVRRAGRIGWRREEGTLRIPGLFLSQTLPAGARLDAEGRLVATLSGGAPGIVDHLRPGAGAWRVRTLPSAEALVVAFLCGGASAVPTGVDGPPALHATRDGPVDLVLGLPAGGDGTLPVRELRLERVDAARATHVCSATGEPIRVPLSRLATPRPPGTHWLHPGNLFVGPAGAVVVLPEAARPRWVELAAHWNDVYELHFARDDRIVATASVDPAPESEALQVRRIAVPPVARELGVGTIHVKPRSGAPHGIGHLLLIDGR